MKPPLSPFRKVAELEVPLFISVALLLYTHPTTNALHCGAQPFRPDHYSKSMSPRISYQGWGAWWRPIGFSPRNLWPRLKRFVWDVGGGAEGRGGGECSHTYSWRGGLRASCYVWMMKSSSYPPPNRHTHARFNRASGFRDGLSLCRLIFIIGQAL